LSAEMAQASPSSDITTAEACYARAVLCEDLGLHSGLALSPPLALSSWAGRTGLSELPPLDGPIDWYVWARAVKISLPALLAYAQAVYTATDAYLATLQDVSPDCTRDEHQFLSALLFTLAIRRGEIARLLANGRSPATV